MKSNFRVADIKSPLAFFRMQHPHCRRAITPRSPRCLCHLWGIKRWNRAESGARRNLMKREHTTKFHGCKHFFDNFREIAVFSPRGRPPPPLSSAFPADSRDRVVANYGENCEKHRKKSLFCEFSHRFNRLSSLSSLSDSAVLQSQGAGVTDAWRATPEHMECSNRPVL